MTNKFVEEALYHPGYEGAVFKDGASHLATEIDQHRKSNARYLRFANVIVDFCASQQNKLHFAK